MEDKIISRVTEILLDKYLLKSKFGKIEAYKRGNIKKNNILVGDLVECEKSYDKYMIRRVLERKNQVIRPPVANIDQMIIVLSIVNPKPDYILLDKQLILCKSKNIIPIICINKIDLCDDLEYIQNVYSKLGIKVLFVSCKENIGIEELTKCLVGKVSAFSGNSGVGKSSIIKKIMGDNHDILVGNLGSKTNKGKHTTKYVKIYEFMEDSYILDTPGFSSYELYDINYKELKNYYEEFLTCKCEYDDCRHILEDENVCDVKRQVAIGKIDEERYNRYAYIYDKLKQQDDKKYK